MATQKGRNWSSGDIVTAANLSSVERGVSAVSSLYEPTTWANGDTVTAAALNNIEQGIVNADGGGKTWVTLCEEEVTTETIEDGNQSMYGALLSYSQLISADIIRVTFDGNEYMCENVSPEETTYIYGGFTETGPDFSEYPFIIGSSPIPNAGVANQIATETSGTHTVKIEVLQESSGSLDFSTATLTLTRGETNDGRLYVPNLTASPIGTLLFPFLNDTVGTSTHNIVIYSGGTVLIYDGTHMIAIDGDIQSMGQGAYLITGNCAITILNSSSVEAQ